MPISWDSSEYDTEGNEAQQEQRADAFVDSLEEPVSNFEDKISEVEKRLEVASYYKLLLQNGLFEDSSEAARIVEREVREYIRERLEILLGIRQPKAQVIEKQVFSDDQVEALRLVADKLIGKPTLVESKPAAPKKPTLKKVAPVEVQPVLQKKAVAPKPALRRVPKQEEEPAPAPAPRPAPVEAKKPPPATRRAQVQAGDPTKPPDAQEVPLDSDLDNVAQAPVVIVDGSRKKWVKNALNTVYLRDAGQVQPKARKSFPTIDQMEQITRAQAMEVTSKLDGVTARAVQETLK